MSNTTRLQHACKEMMGCLETGRAPCLEQRERWEQLLFSPEALERYARLVDGMVAACEHMKEIAGDEPWYHAYLDSSGEMVEDDK